MTFIKPNGITSNCLLTGDTSLRACDELKVKDPAFSLLSHAMLALATVMSVAGSCLAQQTGSPCQPPQPNEYLLLVLSQTQESQQQIQRTLPASTQTTVCQYREDTVTRIAGFRNVEDASSWARYVREIVGLSAFVVRPAQRTTLSTNSLAYNPRPLGEGYAVLVDYLNNPDIAAQVQQLLGSNVGLVSYSQRPYLLAMYTTSERKANSILRKLSDRGFWSMVVDGRRVMLLRTAVSF